MKRKWLLAYSAAFALTSLNWSTAEAAPEDKAPEWSYAAVAELANEGYIADYKATAGISRREMAAYVAEALSRRQTKLDKYGEGMFLSNSDRLAIQKAQQQLGARIAERNKFYLSDNEPDYFISADKEIAKARDKLFGLVTNIAAGSFLSPVIVQEYAQCLYLETRDSENVKYLEARLKKIEKAEKKGAMPRNAVINEGARRALIERRMMLQGWKAKQQQLLASAKNAEKSDAFVKKIAGLRAEFGPELDSAGYFDTEAARQQAALPVPPRTTDEIKTKKLLIQSELRWDYGVSTAEDNRSRLRLRTYFDYKLDDRWHFVSMLENEKGLIGSDSDGKLKWERAYLGGKAGNVDTLIGKFGVSMAEGNIYDSSFSGIRADTNGPVKYSLLAGNMNNTDSSVALKAAYSDDNFDYEAGLYYFDMKDSNANRNIYMLNVHRKLANNFKLGAMYLYGRDSNAASSGHGYVLSLRHGFADSSVKGSAAQYIKYYHQPQASYVQHTMNGRADAMGGFRGIGLGYDWMLRKNLMVSLEYDYLHGLNDGRMRRTLWGAMTYYFGN